MGREVAHSGADLEHSVSEERPDRVRHPGVEPGRHRECIENLRTAIDVQVVCKGEPDDDQEGGNRIPESDFLAFQIRASLIADRNLVEPGLPLGALDRDLRLDSKPVGANGNATLSGTLVFGVGTQSNNALGSAKVYTTDSFGNFTATYNSVAYPQSFVDSGSNGIFFLDAATTSLTDCTTAVGFYCPASSANFTVTNTGNNGTSAPVMFSIFNAESLFQANPTFSAFSNVGGPFAGAFDYGLPFFYGRSVFFGIEGQTTPGGTGPFYAY